MTTKNTLYGPYKSKQAALDATQNKNGAFGVTIKQRYRGLTIGILNDNNHIDEYWFKDGIEDSHLIKKNIEDITELKLDGNKISFTRKVVDYIPFIITLIIYFYSVKGQIRF